MTKKHQGNSTHNHWGVNEGKECQGESHHTECAVRSARISFTVAFRFPSSYSKNEKGNRVKLGQQGEKT